MVQSGMSHMHAKRWAAARVQLHDACDPVGSTAYAPTRAHAHASKLEYACAHEFAFALASAVACAFGFALGVYVGLSSHGLWNFHVRWS